VRHDQWHAQLQQGGRGDRAGDDVVGNGRNAHPQHQAGDHRQDQRQQQVVAADGENVASERRSDAGERNDADNDADQCAGDAHRYRVAGALDQRVQADQQRVATTLDESADQHQDGNDRKNHRDAELEKTCAEHAQGNPERTAQAKAVHPENDRRTENHNRRQGQADHPGKQRRAPGKQQVNQHQQRDQQIPALLDRAECAGALVFGQALQIGTFGFQMNHPEHRTEIQNGRDQRGLGDFHERHIDGFRHDERHCTHHRRHDLAAHARSGFDAAGESRSIAEAFHQRNGELPGGHHVGDARAGDGPHQR